MRVDPASPDPDRPAPRALARFVVVLSVVAVAAVFGACSLVLALLGLGVPFLLAALGVSALAGLALYATLRDRVLQPLDALTATLTARLAIAPTSPVPPPARRHGARAPT